MLSLLWFSLFLSRQIASIPLYPWSTVHGSGPIMRSSEKRRDRMQATCRGGGRRGGVFLDPQPKWPSYILSILLSPSVVVVVVVAKAAGYTTMSLSTFFSPVLSFAHLSRSIPPELHKKKRGSNPFFFGHVGDVFHPKTLSVLRYSIGTRKDDFPFP